MRYGEWLLSMFSYNRKSLINRNGSERLMRPRCESSCTCTTTPHMPYKNSSAMSCEEKEKPSMATTCDIYPEWLLSGPLAVVVGPTNLTAEADVFAAADAEQMRLFQTASRVVIEVWNILPSEASRTVTISKQLRDLRNAVGAHAEVFVVAWMENKDLVECFLQTCCLVD